MGEQHLNAVEPDVLASLSHSGSSRELFVSLARALPKLASRRFGGGVAREAGALMREAARIAAGTSTVAPGEDDRRFADEIWSTNPAYRRLMQLYLAAGEVLRRLPDHADLDWKTADLARFAISLPVDAAAPTNTLVGNPAALREAVRTRGASVVRGARTAADDIAHGRRLPLSTDARAFRIGQNIAARPGAVIHRSDMYELIQYSPTTERVRSRPLLIVPSHVNKHYLFDLAPDRSFVKRGSDLGLSMFCLSWRNPSPSQGHWGLDAYVTACLEAVDVVSEVTRSEGLHMIGACASGVTVAGTVGYMAQVGDRRVSTVTLLKAVIDGRQEEPADLFSWVAVLRAARRLRRRGIIEGRDLSVLFRVRQANETIWPFWVSNYLMGEVPPANYHRYWGDDHQNFPGALQDDLLDLYERDALLHPNAATVLGTPIDMSKVECEAFFHAAAEDHVSPWKAAFRATESFEGRSEFVLSVAKHIQSAAGARGMKSPPFLAGGELGAGAERWMATARPGRGSWWGHWAEWILGRSGEEGSAPRRLGSRRHPPIEPAPGRYVTESPR